MMSISLLGKGVYSYKYMDDWKKLSNTSLPKSSFKRDKSKKDLLTDIDMLLMVEKGFKGGICHAIHRY